LSTLIDSSSRVSELVKKCTLLICNSFTQNQKLPQHFNPYRWKSTTLKSQNKQWKSIKLIFYFQPFINKNPIKKINKNWNLTRKTQLSNYNKFFIMFHLQKNKK
jgi:hypothetical protein